MDAVPELKERPAKGFRLEEWFAPYDQLEEDRSAFPDVTDPRFRRRIMHVVSDKGPGRAAIEQPFHVSIDFLESSPSKGPVLHAHTYPEVFICLQGKYGIYWGERGEHLVELGPRDIFSVPARLMRQVVNIGDGPGVMMVVLDDEDPVRNIFVQQETLDRDRSEGKVNNRKGGLSVQLTPEQVAPFVAHYRDLPVETDGWPRPVDPAGTLRVRRAISPGHRAGPARIVAPHRFHLAYLETEPGLRTEQAAEPFPQVLIGMQGRYSVTLGDPARRVELGPRDTLAVPAGMPHAIEDVGEGFGILMQIQDGVHDPLAHRPWGRAAA